MKRIGFIDYYIDEWHANNYPAWIERASAEKGLDYKVAYCFAELDVSLKYGGTTDEWCERHGVTKCASIDELCEKSDVIVILAPSNPETHLGYAEAALKYGKPTYIDKTFAPNLETANKIFELAKKHNTPFFSTSALRYATELSEYDDAKHITVAGGGSNFPEYSVHLCEMVVKKLGVGIKNVKAIKSGNQLAITADYADGRSAMMIYGAKMPYSIYFSGDNGERYIPVTSSFFDGLISDMLDFFESGKPSFDINETLEIMKLRDMALLAVSKI